MYFMCTITQAVDNNLHVYGYQFLMAMKRLYKD